MSDSREGQEEEAWSREEDDLIPRCSRSLNQIDERDDGEIPLGKQQPERKGKNSKENDKKGGFNTGKMRAKQLLLSAVGRKHSEGTKNMETDPRIIRRSAAPFPYDGKDFGGSPSSKYLCLGRASIPPTPDSPREAVVAAAKPRHSSHYFFVKYLIEKNDFYSLESNPHRQVTGSHAK